VSCVLSGMNSLEQVKRNIEFAGAEHRNTLTPEDLELYARAKEFYQSRTKVNCTQCGYCMPCPQKIPISFILELYNDACMYDAVEDSKRMYRVFVKPENQADQCTECGECMEKCPQHIEIVDFLKEAHRLLK
jgi:predicted aldo/keto reductase-like oxidoreductase